MPLTIDDEILRKAGMSAFELQLEIAVHLFSSERLTLGQASAIAGLTQIEFQHELAKRRIPPHYGVHELEEDLSTLRDAGLM